MLYRRLFLKSGLGLLAGAGVAAAQRVSAEQAETAPHAESAKSAVPPAGTQIKTLTLRVTCDANGAFRAVVV